MSRHMKKGLFEHGLRAGCHVLMTRHDFFFRPSRGTKEPEKFSRKPSTPRKMEVQEAGVQTELASRQGLEYFFAQRLRISWDPVARKPHDDVFIMVRPKSQIRRDRGIELTEG